MQRRGEAALGGDESGIALNPFGHRLEGRVRARKRRRGVGASINLAAEHCGDQIGAFWKVPVQRADADAGLLGDVADRRVDARGGEGRFGRL